jgi:hypothetical protein
MARGDKRRDNRTMVIRADGSRRVLVVAAILSIVVLASCGSAPTAGSHLTAKASAVTTSTVAAPPVATTPTSGLPTSPDAYDPGYSTIDELVKDSTFIIAGTLEPEQSGKGQDGSIAESYPITTEKALGTVPPIALSVTPAEVGAAQLRVGNLYVFFWAADSTAKTACIVGGVRGVMAYNATTDIVTGLDDSSTSQIPRAQSYEQLAGAVEAAEKVLNPQPTASRPPVCSPSATGLTS